MLCIKQGVGAERKVKKGPNKHMWTERVLPIVKLDEQKAEPTFHFILFWFIVVFVGGGKLAWGQLAHA